MNLIWTKTSLYDEGISIKNLALIELDEKGLILNQEEYTNLKASYHLKGKKLYEDPFRYVLGVNLFKLLESIKDGSPIRFLNSIPVSLSMGYDFGLELSQLFDCDTTTSEEAAWTCALAHTSGSLFDILLDDMPELFPAATNLIFRSFKRIFPKTQVPKSVQIDMPVISNPFLRVFRRTTEAFGSRIKDICESASRDLAEEFKNVIEAVLIAEIPTNFGSGTPAMRYHEVYEHLRRRNSLPFWGEALICMMYSPPHRIHNLKFWKETLLNFGDIFWIIDDITDLVDDMKYHRWNYLILKLAEASRIPLDKQPSGPEGHRKIYNELIYHKILSKSIDQLSSGFEGLRAQFHIVHKSPNAISNLVKLWICTHMRAPIFLRKMQTPASR